MNNPISRVVNGFSIHGHLMPFASTSCCTCIILFWCIRFSLWELVGGTNNCTLYLHQLPYWASPELSGSCRGFWVATGHKFMLLDHRGAMSPRARSISTISPQDPGGIITRSTVLRLGETLVRLLINDA